MIIIAKIRNFLNLVEKKQGHIAPDLTPRQTTTIEIHTEDEKIKTLWNIPHTLALAESQRTD